VEKEKGYVAARLAIMNASNYALSRGGLRRQSQKDAAQKNEGPGREYREFALGLNAQVIQGEPSEGL